MTRKFQDLADEVNLFWYDVRRALEIPIVDAARKAALQGINRRLAELTSQLDRCVRDPVQFGIGLSLSRVQPEDKGTILLCLCVFSELTAGITQLAALQTQAMEKVAAGASAALLILLTMCPNAFDAPMVRVPMF